jgi:hypothetical protein
MTRGRPVEVCCAAETCASAAAEYSVRTASPTQDRCGPMISPCHLLRFHRGGVCALLTCQSREMTYIPKQDRAAATVHIRGGPNHDCCCRIAILAAATPTAVTEVTFCGDGRHHRPAATPEHFPPLAARHVIAPSLGSALGRIEITRLGMSVMIMEGVVGKTSEVQILSPRPFIPKAISFLYPSLKLSHSKRSKPFCSHFIAYVTAVTENSCT